ncbi:MAG: hypothetical protein ACRDZ8_04375 [Acidimicrobiales bacterium]
MLAVVGAGRRVDPTLMKRVVGAIEGAPRFPPIRAAARAGGSKPGVLGVLGVLEVLEVLEALEASGALGVRKAEPTWSPGSAP